MVINLFAPIAGEQPAQGWVEFKEPLIKAACDLLRLWRRYGKTLLHKGNLL